MKNYSLGFRPYTTQFDGSEVTVSIKPLDLDAWGLITPFFKQDGEVVKMVAKSAELQQVARPILPKFCQNLSGFMIDGQHPNMETITDSLVFQALVIDILTKLIEISVLTEDESKNLKGASTSLRLTGTKVIPSSDAPLNTGSTCSESAMIGTSTEAPQMVKENGKSEQDTIQGLHGLTESQA